MVRRRGTRLALYFAISVKYFDSSVSETYGSHEGTMAALWPQTTSRSGYDSIIRVEPVSVCLYNAEYRARDGRGQVQMLDSQNLSYTDKNWKEQYNATI